MHNKFISRLRTYNCSSLFTNHSHSCIHHQWYTIFFFILFCAFMRFFSFSYPHFVYNWFYSTICICSTSVKQFKQHKLSANGPRTHHFVVCNKSLNRIRLWISNASTRKERSFAVMGFLNFASIKSQFNEKNRKENWNGKKHEIWNSSLH